MRTRRLTGARRVQSQNNAPRLPQLFFSIFLFLFPFISLSLPFTQLYNVKKKGKPQLYARQVSS